MAELDAEGVRELLTQQYPSGEAVRVAADFDAWHRKELAKAWDEGCAAGHYNEMAVCQCAAWYEHECACGNFGNGEKPETNPYKEA